MLQLRVLNKQGKTGYFSNGKLHIIDNWVNSHSGHVEGVDYNHPRQLRHHDDIDYIERLVYSRRENVDDCEDNQFFLPSSPCTTQPLLPVSPTPAPSLTTNRLKSFSLLPFYWHVRKDYYLALYTWRAAKPRHKHNLIMRFDDDVVLTSDTPQGLQASQDISYNTSKQLSLVINLEKSNTLLYSEMGYYLAKREQWHLGRQEVKIVNTWYTWPHHVAAMKLRGVHTSTRIVSSTTTSARLSSFHNDGMKSQARTPYMCIQSVSP